MPTRSEEFRAWPTKNGGEQTRTLLSRKGLCRGNPLPAHGAQFRSLLTLEIEGGTAKQLFEFAILGGNA
jgi:hypothetical protein